MKTDPMQALRQIMLDPGRSPREHREAAAHAAALWDASLELPIADDDPDLLQLSQPWAYTHCTPEERVIVSRYAAANGGDGRPIEEARAMVVEMRRKAARYARVCDITLPLPERLAVCQILLDDPETKPTYRRNNYTPERLLATITGDRIARQGHYGPYTASQ
jgi:hypothetical protein